MTAKVLIVDDQDFIVSLLSAILRREGYVVLSANNGWDGLKLCRQEAIDLLVTDYNMPLMNGGELARKCAEIRSELRVLYVSGSRPDEDLEVALQEPKRDFISKPFRPAQLAAKARALLAPDAVPEPAGQGAR